MTQCSRAPPGSRASTNGAASSRRRPAAAASRWASRRTSDSAANTTSVCSMPRPRSIHTSRGPLTMTSVMPGMRRSGSSGPAPTRSCRSVRTRSRIASSPSTRPSARSAAATRAGVASASVVTSLDRTRSSSVVLMRRGRASSPSPAARPGTPSRRRRAARAARPRRRATTSPVDCGIRVRMGADRAERTASSLTPRASVRSTIPSDAHRGWTTVRSRAAADVERTRFCTTSSASCARARTSSPAGWR